MTQQVVFTCDWPSCLGSSDSHEDEMLDGGWMLVRYVDDDTEYDSHFCRSGCLQEWAAERVKTGRDRAEA